MHQLVSAALRTAAAQVGTKETTPNWGDRVSDYLAAVHIPFPAPWCAAFARWTLLRAAAELSMAPESVPILTTLGAREFAACANIHRWAMRNGLLRSSPEEGDLFLLLSRGRARHTGFVTRVTGARFETIEGNTNLDGAPEGIGVFARSRPVTGAYRFVRYIEQVRSGPRGYRLFLGDAVEPLLTMRLESGCSFVPVRAWGRALGFGVEWDNERQALLFDGREVDVELSELEDGVNYAPVRDLARAAGLRLWVDDRRREVRILR